MYVHCSEDSGLSSSGSRETKWSLDSYAGESAQAYRPSESSAVTSLSSAAAAGVGEGRG